MYCYFSCKLLDIESTEAVPPALSRCDTDLLIAEATDAIANVVIDDAPGDLERSNTAELLIPPLGVNELCDPEHSAKEAAEGELVASFIFSSVTKICYRLPYTLPYLSFVSQIMIVLK